MHGADNDEAFLRDTAARWDELADDELIQAIVCSDVVPPQRVLGRMCEHVAAATFGPETAQRIDAQLVGLEWHARFLAPGDRLPPGEQHYLKHVVAQAEWPYGTTEAAYLESLRAAVLSPSAGILASTYSGRWHVTFVGRAGAMRGIGGGAWIMLEYDVSSGRWVTGFQPAGGLGYVVENRKREGLRWLREPGARN